MRGDEMFPFRVLALKLGISAISLHVPSYIRKGELNLYYRTKKIKDFYVHVRWPSALSAHKSWKFLGEFSWNNTHMHTHTHSHTRALTQNIALSKCFKLTGMCKQISCMLHWVSERCGYITQLVLKRKHTRTHSQIWHHLSKSRCNQCSMGWVHTTNLKC